MTDKRIRLPNGEVVDGSELSRGWECLRCGEFIEQIEEEPKPDSRMHRFEVGGYAGNNDPNRRHTGDERSGILCPDCRTLLDAFLDGNRWEAFDIYQRLTEAFRQQNDLDGSDIDSQWRIVKEEFEEMDRAFKSYQSVRDADAAETEPPREEVRESLAEEMADAIFTIHLAARMLGVDLRGEFREKAEYNLEKSGERDENGKIIDDATGETND